MENLENFIIVSGFFDVKKRVPDFPKRSIDQYLQLFKYIYDLNIPTILFTEKEYIDYYPDRSGFTTIELNIEDMPNYKKIMNNTDCKITGDATINTAYSAVTTSKTYILKMAKKYIIDNMSDYIGKHIVWLDAGIAHNCTVSRNKFIKDITYNLSDKLTLVMIKMVQKEQIEDMKKYLSQFDNSIAGGLIIAPWNKIEWFYKKTQNLFDKAVDEYKIICLEEQFFGILSCQHEDSFDFIFSHFWFLFNLRYIKVHIHAPIENLTLCRSHSNYKIGTKLANKLFESIKSSKVYLSHKELVSILYESQIIYYYTNREKSKKIAELIYYLYHNITYSKNYLVKYSTLKRNLSFVNVDLDKENLYTLDTLDPEYVKYIWISL